MSRWGQEVSVWGQIAIAGRRTEADVPGSRLDSEGHVDVMYKHACRRLQVGALLGSGVFGVAFRAG